MVRLEAHDLARRRSRRATITALAVGLAGVLVILAVAAPAIARPQHRVFLASAREQPDLARVTLPLYRGTSDRDTVWYVVTDASTRTLALRLGVNYAPRLRAARGTSAVMRVRRNANGTLNFPATVDFRPRRQFVPDPAWYGGAEMGLPFGAPPKAGAVGAERYSPLIELPNGTILNASHVANSTGRADKALNIRKRPLRVLRRARKTFAISGRVTFEETAGFFAGHTIHYISVDASAEAGAVLEDVTLAPSLAAAPGDAAGGNTNPAISARAGIIAFTNGQYGLGNPNRQSLGSTLVDAAAVPGATGDNPRKPPPVPLNIIQAVPVDSPTSLYSPLWDVHLTRWDPTKTPYAGRTRQTSFEAVQALDAGGLLTQPNGMGRFGPSGVVANCPIISTDGPMDMVIPPPN